MPLETIITSNRKSLWIALSDLFLDTDIQDHNFTHIAKTMKESGYSLTKIQDILMLEVFPVCIPNLHAVHGEWEGFRENWVVQKISASKTPNRFQRWMHKRSFWMIEKDWEEVVKRYHQL